jgi:hypothetical protein
VVEESDICACSKVGGDSLMQYLSDGPNQAVGFMQGGRQTGEHA